jgi:hypothetical protein
MEYILVGKQLFNSDHVLMMRHEAGEAIVSLVDGDIVRVSLLDSEWTALCKSVLSDESSQPRRQSRGRSDATSAVMSSVLDGFKDMEVLQDRLKTMIDGAESAPEPESPQSVTAKGGVLTDEEIDDIVKRIQKK